MASLAEAARLLGVPLPELTASTAAEDLQKWKDGPLKAAWRRVARENHPDRSPEPERAAATERFQVLSDLHDRLREIRVEARAPGGWVGPGDSSAAADGVPPPRAPEPAYTTTEPPPGAPRHRTVRTWTDAKGVTHTHVHQWGGGWRR